MVERLTAYIVPSLLYRNRHTATVILCTFLLIRPVISQDIFTEDTVNISAVTVTAAASIRQSPFISLKIDSATVSLLEGDDLATLLQTATAMTVKRNGNTGLASVSIRGLSGSHTMLTWNGLPVNAPSNGYSDFAIIPVLSTSSVKITSGGSDLRDIFGTAGGKIELSTEPDYRKGTEVTLALGAGSYRDYSSALTVRTGNDRISASMNIWGSKARNDFLFVNFNSPEGRIIDRRTNSSCAGDGVMTDISYRSGSSTIAAHIWYNNYDRELPGPVTTVQQDFGELQKDRSVRSVIRYTFASKRFMSEITAGQSYEINLYNNKTYSTEGDNRSAIYLLKANLVFKPGQEIEVILNTGDEYQIARSLGYSEKQWRNVMSASLTTVYHPGTRLKLMLQGRQMFVTGTTLRPELTAAGTFLLTGNGKHIIKANISRNSEIPCLNDLYWVPGGNISLMPETSIGEEAGYSFVSLDPSGRRNTIDISLYRSKVDNLIQWIPGENGIWSAQNIRTVNTSGLESRFGTVIPLKNGSLKADLTYALTRTVSTKSEVPNDRSVGKQLIYTPLNHLNMSVSARRKFIRAGFATLFESRRFTSSDDSEWLPPSFIADANIGTVLKVRKSIFSFILKVNNVFNTPYESVSNYPMPLRTYTIKLNITFTNKSKIDEKHF